MSDEERVGADAEGIAAYARRLGVASPTVRRVRLGADRGALSALRWGEGDPRIVLLHGAGLHAGTWNRMLLNLPVPSLAVDLPGHGESDRLAVEDYRIGPMGDMLAQALARAGVAPTAIVGHSLGSFVGVRAAQVLGGIADFIVVDATPHRLGVSDPTRVHAAPLEVLVQAMLARMPHRDPASLERSLLRNTRARADGLREWLWDELFVEAVPLRALERDAVWQSFREAAQRTVLVRGERGGILDAEAAEFLERVPNTTLVNAPGAGHNVQTDRPEWLAAWLHEHITR